MSKKLGLYIVKEEEEVNGDVWQRNALYHNGKRILRSSKSVNNFGAYVVGDKLMFDGVPVAEQGEMQGVGSGITVHGDEEVNFGDAEIQNAYSEDLGEKCINVTLEDYNRLLAGDVPSGYTRFDMHAIYRIVEDVSEADTVYFKRDAENPRKYTVDGVDYYDAPLEFGLWNNLQGYADLDENLLTDNTYKCMDCPQVSIHDPAFRAAPGERIDLTYMVDTHQCHFTNYDSIGENGEHYTFTVIIKNAYGDVMYKNTHYAGVFTVKLPAFTHGGSNITGETWYSIEVIDWRGCGSHVVYADILLQAADTSEEYQVTDSDLEAYDIVPSTAGEPIDDSFAEDYGATGWSGAYVYNGGGCIKIGTADYVGYLETPSFNLAGVVGNVNLAITIKARHGKYYNPIRVTCGEISQDIRLTQSMATYHITLEKVAKSATTKVRFSTVGGERRCYIESITVNAISGSNTSAQVASFSTPNDAPQAEDDDVTGIDAVTGYKNKVGLSNLFADLKNGNNGYTACSRIKMPKAKVIYIEHRANQSAVAGEYDFGHVDFYVAKVTRDTSNSNDHGTAVLTKIQRNGTITIDSGDYKQEIWKLDTQGNHVSTYGYNAGDGNPCHITGGTFAVDCDPLEWVRKDGARILRLGNYVSDSADADKVLVRWASSADTDKDTKPADPLPGTLIESKEIYNESITALGSKKYPPYLMTHKKSFMESHSNSFIESGYYYAVDNTETYDDGILFPDNFTIDLNGCTLKSVYCESLDHADVIAPLYNFNLHIRNGKFVGLYERYRELSRDDYRWGGFVDNFLACDVEGKFVGETLSTMTVYGSRFCTFDDLDISNSVGYNCRLMAKSRPAGCSLGGVTTSDSLLMNETGYVDFRDGTVVSDDLPTWDLPENSLEYTYKYKQDNNDNSYVYLDAFTNNLNNVKITLVHSPLINCAPSVKATPSSQSIPHENCYIDGGAYSEWLSTGKSPYQFISFYDSNGEYIKTIKSRTWCRVKRPMNATKIIMTGYGISHINGSGQRVSSNRYNRNVVFQSSYFGFKAVNIRDVGIEFNRCHIHDCRSGAFSFESIDGAVRRNCTAVHIADAPYTDWFSTDLFGATEDGRLVTNLVTIANLVVDRPELRDDGGPSFGSRVFKLIYGTNVTISGFVGAGINVSSVMDSYIHDNDFGTVSPMKRRLAPTANMIWRHNRMNKLVLNRVGGDNGTTLDLSINRSEEPIDPTITMWDTHAATTAPGTGLTSSNGHVMNIKQSKISETEYE